MDRWRLSGASGVSEVLNDAASISEVGTMPPGSWQSRWSERRHRTGADDRRRWESLFSLACVFDAGGNVTDLLQKSLDSQPLCIDNLNVPH